ncbi:hypothetical protein [Leptolyngbya sp. GGD]|uniref:hypothetical protein n=1 Tax=Leptolyngbya sp. GGD TaxID=2997907 RepID=UPI00227B8C19|nr:hypothetical protein [Leptolyngbya sp. GGD]MCY6489442.1 hypothetical protein [Leptolyngbya sp. GGD]
MTVELQQAIHLAQSLSFAEQLELLKMLSVMIQQSHALETETSTSEVDTEFSAASFQQSWEQAITGQTLPLSQLWEGIDVE